jgi:hypothetical protein
MSHLRTAASPESPENGPFHSAPGLDPDPDLDAVWKVAAALDVDDRGPLEAEVLLWRICSAKSIPDTVIRRAVSEEWKANP